jgi:hypothetical protein
MKPVELHGAQAEMVSGMNYALSLKFYERTTRGFVSFLLKTSAENQHTQHRHL